MSQQSTPVIGDSTSNSTSNSTSTATSTIARALPWVRFNPEIDIKIFHPVGPLLDFPEYERYSQDEYTGSSIASSFDNLLAVPGPPPRLSWSALTTKVPCRAWALTPREWKMVDTARQNASTSYRKAMYNAAYWSSQVVAADITRMRSGRTPDATILPALDEDPALKSLIKQ
ncbi:hypothetical protein BC939DRAFT_533314 [Gamsiella multidivaricata]|uniref:uncharacterized protein n=1 Tax=Gamsiella multidivaricata TaxID=101098 RepID=UPI00221EB983|nr:uncharacterized protein BC939DRAFT_533314 [Gamsiella multidivaricata]KAI7816751.1 hypothetical protein BC939DRAFT_533314 [Gamsiella multidivaricata]